jgi:hypothetical protein
MTITAPQNEVPPPAGATYVDSWDYDGPEDEISDAVLLWHPPVIRLDV